ncbi:MAG: glycoside hydrolase family 3 N-terminal domain-containing protein [Candidatus Krumholzibacteriia bacterium]
MRTTVLLCCLVLVAACTSEVVPPPVTVTPAPAPVPAATTAEVPEVPVASPVDSLLASLDARALVGQMIVVYRADNAFLLDHGFGGVLLFKTMLRDPVSLRRDLDALQAAAPVPYLVALDQEGGAVSRLDALPGWEQGTPGAVAMGGWPQDAVRAEGRRIGLVLAGLGVNLNLAPVLDSAVAWDGATGWMGRRGRAFGAGAAEIVPAARAFAAGCRDAGVGCLAKHFPGYDVAANSDLEPARSGADLPAIEAGAARFAALGDVATGLMMSSIIYPPVDEAPAVLSPAVVRLARRASPAGLIMTDDLWGTALRGWQRPDLQILPAEYPDADWLALGERAVRAGNDLLLVTYPAKAALLQRLLAERLPADAELRGLVEAAVRRVLAAKVELGLVPRGTSAP